MPVIRTDRRCVNYLKTLAKTELGIDFDSVDSTIKEEPESGVLNTPETIPREKLYCECWRDELKELQKVIFYRSSSTEREVDLSDNLSGSEWSIVNTSAPPPPVQG